MIEGLLASRGAAAAWGIFGPVLENIAQAAAQDAAQDAVQAAPDTAPATPDATAEECFESIKGATELSKV
ncbi:MAG: hypothetical protein D3914_05440, partial [Candidatus Electrothrix sp. LOE2]|nr:hypothetical protein [Candidatus Electrothrix sp. LOE2]